MTACGMRESVSKPSTNSAMIRKIRQVSSVVKSGGGAWSCKRFSFNGFGLWAGAGPQGNGAPRAEPAAARALEPEGEG